jgi:hypothetical protein
MRRTCLGGAFQLAPPFRFSDLHSRERSCCTLADRDAFAILPPAFGHFHSFMIGMNEAALRRIGNRCKE